MADSIQIRRPDDLHVHLREGQMLRDVLPYTTRQFGRATVMPNLSKPILTVEDARRYREEILAAIPDGVDFTPLMTCYLTDGCSANSIEAGFCEGIFTAAKLYPAHATTNSKFGVTDMSKIHNTLFRLEKIGMPLLIHGEKAAPEIDIFDRERVFIETTLVALLETFPKLKIVLEHITSGYAVDFLRKHGGPRLAATITPHHLLINRNDLLAGGIRPHYYCLPIAKREEDRIALRKAATSGLPFFFLGTDSAPHLKNVKESACGCAGVFNAPTALETYAQAFDEEDALDHLEGFASTHGATFYGLPLNDGTISLRKDPYTYKSDFQTGKVAVFRDGETLSWRLENAPPLAHETFIESRSRSAASPWLGERPPHLPCRLGELPDAVLFPGDPGRVDRFANILTDFRIIGQNREFKVATGKFNGVELGVCSTGIGGPSTEIALVEAARLGCKYALRVGGTGALRADLAVGTLLIVSEALRGGGAAASYVPIDKMGQAHPEMVAALETSASDLGFTTVGARVASTDSYYAGQDRAYPHSDSRSQTKLDEYRRSGADAVDMEAETILVIGEALGLVSGVVLAVHANRSSDEWLEEFGDAQDRMIMLGCEALSRLSGGNKVSGEETNALERSAS